jgi:hypothetical protein
LIGELAKDNRVIALSFHVDYWDRLGWRDPFSSPMWTARQVAYARTMKLGSAYTPQMVVGGEFQMIGSDRRAVEEAIDRVSHEQRAARVGIADGVARGFAPHPLDLYALVVQNSAPTPVKAGENAGRTLRNDAIVREMKLVAHVNGTFEQTIPANANVVLLQDPATLRIAAAAHLHSSS